MPWLDKLQDYQVPVILCSSKSAAEMLDIQQDLGLEGLPFIAENGAVIQPDVRWEMGQSQITGMTHREIHPLIEQIRQQAGFKFVTFDDVNERVISEWTGLTRYRAALARKHDASVTLIWRDTDDAMLTVQRRGDRFEMVTLAGDIRLLQDHHLTPCQEGGKGKDDKKTEIND
ncbi:hypothetical protein OsI_07261 [Oryza sativa Indica Group]|uniref:Mannosyl-3-phosphoglycerate phosphatase n=1 Tax=Oryza sativa subsp. indica TaxID=39946 RepID=B8AHZ7_ORYSI|nr:hypothetical protein OsI_07261 [Oryza sativa Indica Group]